MPDLQEPLVRPKRKRVLVDYLVQFRWIVVIFVVLPISTLIYFNIYLGDMWSAMKSEKRRQKEHDDNVQKVVKRLKQRNPKKDGLVCTARKPWIAVGMRNVDYKRARHFEVDLSAFRNIVEIDKERMVAKVEPLVNMGQISRATCPLNLALAVVAELDDLTVGGLINGYGIEGSSHLYGLFSDTVVAMEVVLADGRVVRATKDNEYSDLFYGIPWSQGTLGFLVSAEIKLIPIKEYMRLTYTPVKGTLKEMAQAYADSFAPRDGDPAKVPDFVEGMVYTATEGVMMTGVYASKEEAKKKGNKINSVGWWFKPWFYQHAQTALKKGEFVEYIPTRQYYHRHTRCLYWEGKLILPFGDQFWFRFLLGWPPIHQFPNRENPIRSQIAPPPPRATMMFTEGLDESAISWIKQGTDAPPPAAATRSPLAERPPAGQIAALRNPALHRAAACGSSLFSPKSLPPVRTGTRHSGLLGRHSVLLAAADSEGDEEESVASWGVPEDCCYGNFSDTVEEDGVCSSDSSLFRRARDLYGGGADDEVTSQLSRRGGCLVRGQSKENLRVEVRAASAFAGKCSGGQDPVDSSSHEHYFGEQKFQALGTPSAPPIAGDGEEAIFDTVAEKKEGSERTGVSSVADILAQDVHELPTRSNVQEDGVQVPYVENNLLAQIPSFTTNVQNAWQSFVAYDACFRLCLNAWARNCMEAPEFLRDECMVLRSAFGIQKFLLHPRYKNQDDGKHAYDKDGSCTMKGRKLVKEIEIEVKKIRVVPQRPKLRATSSFRNLYMQAGSEYVRQISKILKSQVTMLTSTSSTSLPEEMFTCMLELQSSCKGRQRDSISPQYLKPGTGESQLFYLESQGDAILVEVQDNNRVVIGRAKIQVSSFTDAHTEEIIRWWPLYLDDQECVGKIQLCINLSMSSNNYGSAKMLQGGPAVDTIVYDMVLEAAMRAQNFNSKMLHIGGSWNWLLDEFSDYYGVSDAYRKLRYLSYIMNVATPTKDCLELTYELLLPVMKAWDDRTLTRQERSILLDCEDRINRLLAVVFENYKSLDEHSPTGLSDIFGPISDCAAPALAPAVQIFSVLHDILSNEAQNILMKYLQTAAAKRCRRHMIETDEFMSSNNDSLLTDPMTISAAYLKMKTLCINIGREIQADIKIHNQNILPSSIDLPNIEASLYSTELCKRLKGFLSASPPSRPLYHVAELLIATADFERDLDSWQVRPVPGGVVSRELFHDYIMVWIEDTRLHLLDNCKAEKISCPAMSTTSPFVEQIYEQIKESINEYGVVINRWPQYLMSLESAVADVEREIMKALEKQYMETLIPLRDGIPKILEKQVQRLTRRQSIAPYVVPNQLGTFMNTVKRMLDVLHCRVEDILKSWAAYLTITNGNTVFGEQMNSITVMLRKKYKKYLQAIVEKLVSNTQANRTTRLKRILEETRETEGESEIRERMQALRVQLSDSIHNLNEVFSSRIFVAICRGFWDRLGQIVLRFLESRKENRIWYRGSDYALGILDDVFASEMQKLLGNALQDKDLDPPQSVIDARSILC